MQDHIENRMEGVPWQRVELSQRQRVRQKTIKRIKSLTIWAGGCNLPGHGKDPATIEVLAGWDSDKQLDSVWALHLTSAEARSLAKALLAIADDFDAAVDGAWE